MSLSSELDYVYRALLFEFSYPSVKRNKLYRKISEEFYEH